jgi:hypothetical protein
MISSQPYIGLLAKFQVAEGVVPEAMEDQLRDFVS